MKECRNSQKPLTGCMSDACAKKRKRLGKRKKPFSFISDRWVENTYIFLAAGGGWGASVRFMWNAS